MNMSDLICAVVGDDDCTFQALDKAFDSIDKRKRGTKVSFYTDAIQPEEMLGGGVTKKMGIILWLPRDKVEALIAAEKLKKASAR